MRLSYTSLNAIMNGHEWLNKQMGIPVPNYPFLKEGRAGHRIIQDHVAGINRHLFLDHIEIEFPTVEIVNFDENCKFSYDVDGYEIFGFLDGFDAKNNRFLEIKLSSQPWSIKKFKDSMQRKLYGLCLMDYTESYLITGSKNPQEWSDNPPKVYSVPITSQDKEEALLWTREGIRKLSEGDFSGGLDENKKCTGCFYNMPMYKELANCHFL